jgi:hypothetical protein
MLSDFQFILIFLLAVLACVLVGIAVLLSQICDAVRKLKNSGS